MILNAYIFGYIHIITKSLGGRIHDASSEVDASRVSVVQDFYCGIGRLEFWCGIMGNLYIRTTAVVRIVKS